MEASSFLKLASFLRKKSLIRGHRTGNQEIWYRNLDCWARDEYRFGKIFVRIYIDHYL